MAFVCEADRKLLVVGQSGNSVTSRYYSQADLKSLNLMHVFVISEVRNDVAEFPRNHQFPVSGEMLASTKTKKKKNVGDKANVRTCKSQAQPPIFSLERHWVMCSGWITDPVRNTLTCRMLRQQTSRRNKRAGVRALTGSDTLLVTKHVHMGS